MDPAVDTSSWFSGRGMILALLLNDSRIEKSEEELKEVYLRYLEGHLRWRSGTLCLGLRQHM